MDENPQQKFNSAFRLVRYAFQIAGQDIFLKNFRRDSWFYGFFALYLMGVSFDLITAFFDTKVDDVRVKFICTSIGISGIQVRFSLDSTKN